AAAPVLAANRGTVVFAGWLGIYGNCVIVDHGMGLQSLYAHLSTIEVNVGDAIERDQRLGRTGATGLAGGDHLHFTMLLNGQALTPIGGGSARCVQAPIVRKLREPEALCPPPRRRRKPSSSVGAAVQPRLLRRDRTGTYSQRPWKGLCTTASRGRLAR